MGMEMTKNIRNKKPDKKKRNYTYTLWRFYLMTGDIVAAAKLIGAGLAMIGTIGAGAGIGILVSGAVQGMARNPDAAGNVQTNMILGIAFAEAVAIYCLVVALLILFVF
jgi:ATP synthase F0 subunit c